MFEGQNQFVPQTSSKGLNKPLIWVYDINNSAENGCLVEGAPFKTKTECSKIMAVSRSTVLAYLDKGKLLNNKLISTNTKQLIWWKDKWRRLWEYLLTILL